MCLQSNPFLVLVTLGEFVLGSVQEQGFRDAVMLVTWPSLLVCRVKGEVLR